MPHQEEGIQQRLTNECTESHREVDTSEASEHSTRVGGVDPEMSTANSYVRATETLQRQIPASTSRTLRNKTKTPNLRGRKKERSE